MPTPRTSSSRGELTAALAEVAATCPGVVEALIVEAGGVVCERWSRGAAAAGTGAPPPNDLGADIAGALPALGRVAVSGRLGRPSEWLLTGERGTVVVRRIGPLERFLVFRVGAGEWVGRARYAARAFAERIQTLLPAP